MDAKDFFELADRSPCSRFRPLLHYWTMLLCHKWRHQGIDTQANNFIIRKPEHVLDITRSTSDNSHNLGIYKCFDDTRSFMINKSSKLFDVI